MRISDWSSDVCSSDLLLELFTVVIAGGDFDLLTDRFHAALDRIGFTGAINDGGVVLVDGDALGLAEHADGHALQLDAQVFGNHLALGQDRDVFQHGLAAIAERSEEHTSELQSLMRISYAVF